MNIADPTICNWQPAPYFIFSDNIWGNFIYYSHLFPSLAGLLIAIVVFLNARESKAAQALLFTNVMFASWSLIDLAIWASDRSDYIMFFWSSLVYFEFFIYVGSFYFAYSFYRNKWPPLKYDLTVLILLLPLFLFSHTALNLTAFDFTNCWREAFEGPLWHYYIYNVELLYAVLIIIAAARTVHKKIRKTGEILAVTFGIIFFLLSFSGGNIFGSLETDWQIGQIGLFGMPIFVFMLAYTIVRYEVFKLKILATEALMIGMLLLLISLFFVRTIENSRVIAGITLLLFIVLGSLLIKSVRKEVHQRQEISKLAKGLERANARLRELDKQKSEFVSIASHQLRSPLAAIRGYASMVVEGSFGKVEEKMIEPLTRIADSAKMMSESVEDFLSVSRIEGGNMKYELADFNLRELAEHITDDLRPEGFKKGLLLLFKTELTSQGLVHADKGKTQQILHNLINNSLKYTPKGTVTVFVHDDIRTKKIIVDIIDTGIGMSNDTIHSLFEKFTRAKNANTVNIKGTGLGLFVAREMARAMGGDVVAHSDGEGHGSRFEFTLPVIL
ncbi:MAG: hypothetical protein RLZZ360_1 [Candidatus Parcubacteria bacterium]|jgi:signal transduction histidine kinase